MWYNMQVAQNAAWASEARTDHWQLNNRRLKYKQKLSAKESRISLKKEMFESITDSDTYSKKYKSQTSSRKILTGNGSNTICSRVWSWLRMNAGGVHNTFKSNEVAIPSGGRVSNAWATCPCVGDTVWKRTLIPHNVMESHGSVTKDLLRKDGLASD